MSLVCTYYEGNIDITDYGYITQLTSFKWLFWRKKILKITNDICYAYINKLLWILHIYNWLVRWQSVNNKVALLLNYYERSLSCTNINWTKSPVFICVLSNNMLFQPLMGPRPPHCNCLSGGVTKNVLPEPERTC